MARKTIWEDAYTLLCERCGYVIEGLDAEGACPECGKPIAESLPERRTGTLWQRDEGNSLRLLGRSWWRTLRSPLKTLDELQAERQRSRRLLVFTLLAVCVTVGMLLGFNLYVWNDIYTVLHAGALGLAAMLVLLLPVLYVLTKIEQFGLWFFARRRGWRVDNVLAGSICAHGSVGWLIGSTACSTFLTFAIVASYQVWYIEIGPLRVDGPKIFLWLAFLSVIVGLIVFEGFTYIGLRRCKFANRGRLQPDEAPDDPEGS